MPAISGPISAGREVRNRRACAEKGPSAREEHECREREHAIVARIGLVIVNKSSQVKSSQTPSTTAGFRSTFDRLPLVVWFFLQT